MANDLGGRFDRHLLGARQDNVTHACPDCPIGYPRALCPTCLGHGTITETDLARWVARRNAEATR